MENGLIERVWSLTHKHAGNSLHKYDYREKLRRLLNQPKRSWFLPPFAVAKKIGKRTIVPATEDLYCVQAVLVNWLLTRYKNTDDYCYTGQGVIEPAKKHQKSVAAVVVDIKNAYDNVTKSKVLSVLAAGFPEVEKDLLQVIAEFFTYPVYRVQGSNLRYSEDTIPQGCISSPYVYNAVVSRSVAMLKLPFERLAKETNFVYTRYVDDIALSVSKGDTNLRFIAKLLRDAFGANGFPIGEPEFYDRLPFEYLGLLIGKNSLEVCDEKDAIFRERLIEAIHSPTPEIYQHQVSGIVGWLNQVYGTVWPLYYIELVTKYQKTVNKPTSQMVKIRSAALNYKLC
jgi:hypothetical protein